LINPYGHFKIIWSCFLGILLVYTAVLTPYKMALVDNESEIKNGWLIADTIVDAGFILDILININMPHVFPDGTIEQSRKVIFFRYLRGWLLIDVCASFPVTFFEMMMIRNGEDRKNPDFVRLTRIPRMYRLVRVSRMIKLLSEFVRSMTFQRI
jgi:hypothetical protein